MSIRLWPKDYNHLSNLNRGELTILRNAARNFTKGHLAVSIDPLGLSTETEKMGMYISPKEGLITFSIKSGQIDPNMIDIYIQLVKILETKIYNRLIDSKHLIVRNGEYKCLKMPYKHVFVFSDVKFAKADLTPEQKQKLYSYATYSFFQPITATGKEKSIKELKIFSDCRMPYDPEFTGLSELKCRAIFERLAPEYAVIMNEREDIKISTSSVTVKDEDMMITGKEQELKTFLLDEYQVGLVNEMGKGHRVILANPGAGKSVLLLSKAFKYASMYKQSKVLLTCFNANLADLYNLKLACADFGSNNNLYIMTLHKLVKKLYSDYLHQNLAGNIATDEEIEKCIALVRNGTIKVRFKAIFVDEVQIFEPLYLELCYYLLEDTDDRLFLMAGDLNQAVRKMSRKGDAPWKRIRDVKLDFKGRVRYIEKNYRNTKEIAEYIKNMLTKMNARLTMLGMINSMEYEYNSFKVGEQPSLALNVKKGISRMDIQKEVIAAVEEISTKYKIPYSDIAILFPYRQHQSFRYYILNWIENGLKDEFIPYTLIINTGNTPFGHTRIANTNGVILSTIDSALGLDFRAVILAGLYPYNYVFNEDGTSHAINSWAEIKAMNSELQSQIQSQLRALYTSCSRAREVLYVLSDLNPGTPMEEILKK